MVNSFGVPLKNVTGASVSAVTDCLFCKIVAGDVPSEEVMSSEGTYAFRDINPGAPTHVLVVPRRHIESAATVTADDADTLYWNPAGLGTLKSQYESGEARY